MLLTVNLYSITTHSKCKLNNEQKAFSTVAINEFMVHLKHKLAVTVMTLTKEYPLLNHTAQSQEQIKHTCISNRN